MICRCIEGIPAFYIHSLLGTRNDYERLESTKRNRTINRHRWQLEELNEILSDTSSQHMKVYSRLNKLIQIRKQQSAFHPNATQFTLHLGTELFGFWRQSMDRRQSIFCISNISNHAVTLPLLDINLISDESWYDLISEQEISSIDGSIEIASYQTYWITNVR